MKSALQFGIVVLAGFAIGAYVERDRLVAYSPPWLAAKFVSGHSAESEKPSSGGKGHGSSISSVKVAVARSGSLPVLYDTVGNVVPVASTVLNSEAVGIVSGIAAQNGASVAKGDLIVQLDDRSANALVAKDKATIDKDQAILSDAEASLNRIKSLVKSGANTQQAGDDAEAAVREAQATIAVDQASLAADEVALSKTRIVAPFDGRLGVIGISVGALVQPGTAIVTVNQTKPVDLQFSLPETLLARAEATMAGHELTVEATTDLSQAPDGGRNDFAGSKTNGSPASGKDDPAANGNRIGDVVFIDNAVDPVSATFKLRAEMLNADSGLLPGQALDVDVRLGDVPNLVLVPNVAVEPRSDASVVYVVRPDETVELRKVEVALRVGGMAGLSAGLAEGERVVVEGQGGLTANANAKVKVVGNPAQKGAPAGQDAHGDHLAKGGDGEGRGTIEVGENASSTARDAAR